MVAKKDAQTSGRGSSSCSARRIASRRSGSARSWSTSQLGRHAGQRGHTEAIGLAPRLDRAGPRADGRGLRVVAGVLGGLGRFGQHLERERRVLAGVGRLDQDGNGAAKVAGSRLDHAAQIQELRSRADLS